MTDGAQVRQSKRYLVALRKRGACFACRHRAVTSGQHHCRNNPERTASACMKGDAGPKFTFDDSVMGEFMDRRTHGDG